LYRSLNMAKDATGRSFSSLISGPPLEDERPADYRCGRAAVKIKTGRHDHAPEAKMKWPAVLIVVTLFGNQAGVLAQSARPRASQLAGTWRLLVSQQRLTDGTVKPDPSLGPRAVGYIMYSETGHVCAFLANPDRPKWKSPNKPVESDLRTAFDGFVAYCGTYKVNETDGSVLHHVEMDKVPHLAGINRKRYFTLSGNRLVLRLSPLPRGVKEWTLEWERVG
jgi:hypothetical protein